MWGGNGSGVSGDGVSPSDHRIKGIIKRKLDFKSSKQITKIASRTASTVVLKLVTICTLNKL